MLPLLLCLAALAAQPQPHPVTITKDGDAFQLLRDGKPYFVKGGGGWTNLDLLAKSGGNSIRLWGAEHAGEHLDAADKAGLTATLGIWLGHERHGFSYTNADDLAKLLAHARETAEKHKNHPALLLWGVGNEMEAEHPDNAAIWLAVNAVAAEIKKIDRNHPTMVVIAEIGETKLKRIDELCPDIDIVGVNAYGGAPTLGERYRKAAAKLRAPKPYILAEFGPPGHWEVGKTEWGASLELSSSQKADLYSSIYRKTVLGEPTLCLGSYAFTWGWKQEATTTWFGMLLPDGSRLAAADAMTELWTGAPPRNRCPAIASFKINPPTPPAVLSAGSTIQAVVEASDPEGDVIAASWVLTEEQARYSAGGDATPKLREFPEAILESSPTAATVRIPAEPGAYRLYVYLRDSAGGAATANIPFKAAPAR